MTQPEIETGNKLIAEFMAYQNQNGVEYRIPQHERMIAFNSLTGAKKSNTHFRSDFFKHDELMFHSSWDWLMPVMKEISDYCKQLDFDDEKYIHITEEIFDTDHTFADFWDNDISGIYSRVIEFIQWYNQQTAKP